MGSGGPCRQTGVRRREKRGLEDVPVQEPVSHPSSRVRRAAQHIQLWFQAWGGGRQVGGPRVASAHGWQDTHGTDRSLQGRGVLPPASFPAPPSPRWFSAHTALCSSAARVQCDDRCSMEHPHCRAREEAGRLSAYRHVSLSASTIPPQLSAPWASLSVILATRLQAPHWALGRPTSSVSNAVTCA